MRIKKYIAGTMREALMQIKQDLGEDAVILKTTRQARSLLGKEQIEVTAALDDSRYPPDPGSKVQLGLYSSQGAKNGSVQATATAATQARQQSAEPNIDKLQRDVQGLKQLVSQLVKSKQTEAVSDRRSKPKRAGQEGGWKLFLDQLLDAEVNYELACGLIDQIKASGDAISDEEKLQAVIQTQLPASGPIKLNSKRTTYVALVGPTGTGKTTTMAKLAAHYALEKGVQVGLATADTYRVAAIEQVRTFSEILNVPFYVLFDRHDVQKAKKALSDCQIVFVDCAGRSPHDTSAMEEIDSLINDLQPDETHLVVSATTKDKDLRNIVSLYKQRSVNRLLFTKLDETLSLGNVFNTLSASRIPVSYFTAGQKIPDDISIAHSSSFFKQLLDGHHGS